MNQDKKEVSGVLVVDKHAGATSHDIVNKVRRAYGTRRVGHTGTLDPLATGVLVVLVGRAAKAAEYLCSDTKRYLATLRPGLTTDTEDITGTVLSCTDTLPAPQEVISVCSGFVGKQRQIPPMYSAIKLGGRKLVDLARAGETVERQPRDIEITELTCTPSADSPGDYVLDVTCSAGTYIRTLCADIGASLGCGGVMASLRRLRAGSFGIESAITVDRLFEMTADEREALLLPVESLFSDLPALALPAFYERLCRSGCEIYQKKLRTALPDGIFVRLCGENGVFFALGRVSEYPDGSAVKAVKLFEL